MSLQHVFRAEKLGRADREEEKALEAVRSGGDLGEIRSEAGCNMLLVYLLSRWGRLFSPGGPAAIAATEDFQTRVVDAYVAAGCAIDDAVAPRGFAKHTPPDFARFFRMPNQKLSALGFVQAVLGQTDADMHPAPHAQLVRLEERLRALSLVGGAPALRPQGPEHATATLVRGVRASMALGSSELSDLREAGEALKLALIVGGDEGNLPVDAVVDVAVGVKLSRASAEDGGPITVPAQAATLDETQRRYLESLGDIETLLVASGPLASAYLVQGAVGAEQDGGRGRFVCGADESQAPHAIGVWGEVLAAADAGVRACELPASASDVFLIARYD